MTNQIEIGDILQLSPTLRLVYLGADRVQRQELLELTSGLDQKTKLSQWIEGSESTLTQPQIAGWHARKAK